MTRAERSQALVDDYAHWRLFAASRAGDGSAAIAFDTYWRQAVKSFVGRGFTRDQVEEFASAFFERVYHKAPGFDFKTPFVVFLRTVLLNLSRDELRRVRRVRTRSVSLEEESGRAAFYADSGDDPERAAIAAERRDRVRQALAAVEPAARYLLRELVAEGRPGSEVASELGVTTDNVYQRLHRAKKKLKAELETIARDRRASGNR